MITRLANAYSMVQALVGTAVIVVVGLVLEYRTLGVTRQPLPLVWPLAILHIMIAQLPLREILGPIERVAVRGALARAVRGGVVLVLVTTGALTYVAAKGDRSFLVVFLVLAAVGFTAAAGGPVDPWVWTLGAGMVVVGFMFLTRLGGPIGQFLEGIPVWLVVVVLGLAVCGYVSGGIPMPFPRRGRGRPAG